MSRLIIRTEDIKDDELLNVFVESVKDREIIDKIKNEKQTLIVGSRGSGKTMLLKVAQNELKKEFETNRILPVYLSFSKSILVNSELSKNNFLYWMLAKLLNAFRSSLMKFGIITTSNNPFELLFKADNIEKNSLDEFIEILESSWRNSKKIDKDEIIDILGISSENISIIDDIDFFKRIVQNFCKEFAINNVLFLFDEACHNFIPEQQRMFFSLFRDMRDPYISCTAAVYPGITNYGTIQKLHDVNSIRVERDINDSKYIEDMREMISNQLDEEQYTNLIKNGKELDTLILCSSGNPRLLIRSIELASSNYKSLPKGKVNDNIKDFYRNQIWKEHTKLSEIYTGHKKIIDWGRQFLDESVLPETINKNANRIPNQTIYFSIHRDAPEIVKRAIRILEYSGIIFLHTEATKVRRNIFDRYQINLGIVIAFTSDMNPVDNCLDLYKGLSTKLYTDYGKNSPAYKSLLSLPAIEDDDIQVNQVLENMLSKRINSLPITLRQIEELNAIEIYTIRDVLCANEQSLTAAYQIGPTRARSIYSKAYNAVIEFISG